jgi:archaemetzincin
MNITVLRIGDVNAEAVQKVLHNLGLSFPEAISTIFESVMPVPEEAYNKARRQYNSTLILAKMMNFIKKSNIGRILGVITSDLYVPGLNFVFGEAYFPSKVSLISLFRLKPEFYGQAADKQLFYERTVKEAVHEVGHTLGLVHCRNPSCAMFFSNSIQDTDRKKSTFCEKCQKEVLKVLRKSM